MGGGGRWIEGLGSSLPWCPLNLGNAPPIEADEKFQETHEALVEMLTRQSEVYEREEHALRVLMEEEVMEKMHSHQKECK